MESLRRDISGLLGGRYKTEACFEISNMKQEFIKHNYPDDGGWSARILVTSDIAGVAMSSTCKLFSV